MQRRFLFLILTIACAVLLRAEAASLTANLQSLSVRVDPASFRQFGLTYVLQLTSPDVGPPEINHELVLAPDDVPQTHETVYALYLPNEIDPIYGSMWLDVPNFSDVDDNDLLDFFEQKRSVNATTRGQFDDGTGGTGDATATWTRSAGSGTGTVRIRMVSDFYNLLFTHTFTIKEYTGTYQTVPQAGTFTGSLNLTNIIGQTFTLTGLLETSIVDTNLLRAAPGTLTNELDVALHHEVIDLTRYDDIYQAVVYFDEGDAFAGLPGYDYWYLTLSEGADTDGDGIPDLTDPASTQPIVPSLSIVLTPTGYVVTIRGETGRTYRLQRTPALSPLQWATEQTFVLSSAEQSFTVVGVLDPVSSFYRLLAE